MSKGEVIIKFDAVTFEHGHNHPILNEASFSLRENSKFALMGQNGAGKSTIFGLITGLYAPDEGSVSIRPKLSIATAKQVISRDQLTMSVREFFESFFEEKVYAIDPRIDEVLEIVNLQADHGQLIKTFSGGQQARLLLASALIQNPDLLLLDEPTNNLDTAGIAHLKQFLVAYQKTCIVISHDSDFLNAFTQGVLYLDVFTRKIEQYVGDYFDVVKEITNRIERENAKNAQLAKKIQENKDKANFFAQKGGKMRDVAMKMRKKVEEMEESQVDVRKEDNSIRPFKIPVQPDITGEIVRITSYSIVRERKVVSKKTEIVLKKRDHLLLAGPNGIGKSTLLESIASGKAKGSKIADGVSVGYYRQDFSTLTFEDTVYESLLAVMKEKDEQVLRSVAAGFLISADFIGTKIGSLSEGQKGLVAFARLVLQKPGLLILDEPTNHINFRHLPVIASALDAYEGAMILVSHVPDFVHQIRISEILDLEK